MRNPFEGWGFLEPTVNTGSEKLDQIRTILGVGAHVTLTD